MTTTSIPELERAIEALVQAHLAAYEAQVRAAIGAGATRRAPSSRGKPRAKPATKRGPKRTASELAALCEDFYAAVEANPGETKSVLASQLGLSSRELERPVARLKESGRVRTVGEYGRMRYFPMAALSAA